MPYYRDTPSEQQDVDPSSLGDTGVVLMPDGLSGHRFDAPGGPRAEWEKRICRAFGTRNLSIAIAFLDQLTTLCTISYDRKQERWKPSEIELNFAISLIDSIRPRDQMEAALVAQMVAVHLMQMRVSSRVLGEQDVDARDANAREASVAGKLARTFAIQMDTLMRKRGRGTARQSIKVKKELHQHVHYHDHRGDGETGAEPCAARIIGVQKEGAIGQATGAAAGRPTLPGSDEAGSVVPLAGRERKTRV